MALPTDIQLKQFRVSRRRIDYRSPIKFGGRVVNDVLLLEVQVDVETVDGKRGTGYGAMPMGNVWAWPSQQMDTDATLAALVDMAERSVRDAEAYHEAAHPLEITTQLAARHAQLAAAVEDQHQLPEPIPRLAQLVAASPLEAAIYDAHGKALGQNSYRLLGKEFVSQDLGAYLGGDFSGRYLDEFTSRDPKPRMPLYHLVGALDPLTVDDLEKPIGDGLPETLGDWIVADGLTHLKIKLNGDDLNWDVNRVISVEAVARQAQTRRGCENWNYSLDFNEKCADVEYVMDFLATLREKSPRALDRVQYIEQPTHRDLRAHPENRMHEAARIKPVVIDESLTDLETLQLARDLGYSGVALKACKGQSEALLMGAAAQFHQLFLCVQDLTCIGASFLHSASLAARIPTVAAIEGNGRQYCPAGNEHWRDWYPGMFSINDGTVHTAELDGPGLGYAARER